MDMQGRVVAVAGKSMFVVSESAAVCAGCQTQASCSTQLFNGQLFTQFFSRKEARYEVPKLPAICVGDAVRITIPDSLGIRLAIIAYGLPIFLLISFAMLSQYLAPAGFDANLLATLTGIAGFIGGLIAYRPLSIYALSLVDEPVSVSGILADNAATR